MKKLFLTLLLFTNVVYAKSGSVYDLKKFISPNKFSVHCMINDPGISGSIKIDVYSNGNPSCSTIQELYTKAYTNIHKYLELYKYSFKSPVPIKTLCLRILTLADLNNPNNFSSTDSRCMYSECDSGPYTGLTFYSPTSSNINVYVAYPIKRAVDWKYSFESTIKHELMHAILYRYQWTYLFKADEEHALIDKFLEWERNR